MSEVYTSPVSQGSEPADDKAAASVERDLFGGDVLRIAGAERFRALEEHLLRIGAAIAAIDRRHDEAERRETEASMDVSGAASFSDRDVVWDHLHVDEGDASSRLFMEASGGVERIAAALEEELVEARRFRRSMVARAGEIDAAQRRTEDNLRKLLG